jgi:hypothetical protein
MDGDANTIGNNGMVSPNTNRITGSMTDNGLVVGLELCSEDTEDSMCSQQPVSPAQATTWSYALPVGEENDGVQQQLRVFGKDSAGNVSTTPISLTYTADAVAPVITVTNQLETLSLAQIAAGTPMLAGSVSDGGGVQSVTANILPTEGDTFQQQALNVEQATWSYTPAGLAAGSYFITIEAQDLAGNSRTYGPYDLTITP